MASQKHGFHGAIRSLTWLAMVTMFWLLISKAMANLTHHPLQIPTLFHIVGDLIGLLDHFEQQQVFVVGHDWGAAAAWHLSLFRPDRVKGMISISVPFFPRNPDIKPTQFYKSFGDDFYISQFQEVGRAERSFAKYDHLTVMKKILLLDVDLMAAPAGMESIDYLEAPEVLPSWITEEELQVYADIFQKSGFIGGLNYYRAIDLSWEQEAPWQGSKITVPSKLIVGNKDIGFQSFIKAYIEGDVQKALVPDIEVVILDQGHHFIQQEKPQEVFVVGHDWGATAAWRLSLFRPDRIKGIVAISVPFFPRNPDVKPSEFFKSFGDGFCISQYQETGRAERAFAKYDHLTVMKKFLLIDNIDLMVAPAGMEIIDYLEAPEVLPSWITEEELKVYADTFQKSGFIGGLNYYRAMDLSWELEAPWQGSKITVPSKLIVGNKDIGFKSFIKAYIEGYFHKALVPDIEVVILEEGHHYIQQEKPQKVSDQILSFLQKLAIN